MSRGTHEDAPDVRSILRARRERVDRAIEAYLPPGTGFAATVVDAMRYAILGGGKRLRPAVTLETCAACGGDDALAMPAAVAVEMIHTYSLVHDDLPAMDDDDLRRGRPTVHVRYGDAVAILAGDGLLTLAFEILGRDPEGAELAPLRADATVAIARGAGVAGMVGGQIADLEGEGAAADACRLEWIHRHKTAALFRASAEAGAILAGASADERDAAAEYGDALGLAFQIADDVLDRTATAEQLGKTPGKDAAAGKSTYPALVGLDASRESARQQVARARDNLRRLPGATETLHALAGFAAERSS